MRRFASCGAPSPAGGSSSAGARLRPSRLPDRPSRAQPVRRPLEDSWLSLLGGRRARSNPQQESLDMERLFNILVLNVRSEHVYSAISNALLEGVRRHELL